MTTRPMTAKRFAELTEERWETQEAAARALGIGRRSIVRYVNNQLPVPPKVERLLLMLLKHPRSGAKVTGGTA